MPFLATSLTAAVAAEHYYILWLEMFAWETKGPKVFRGAMPKDLFPKTTTMAANQGLYNGFLATGLVWSLIIEDPVWSKTLPPTFWDVSLWPEPTGRIRLPRKFCMFRESPPS